MGRFSRELPCFFASLFNEEQHLKGNNLQILSFKSWPYLRKEALRNLQKMSPSPLVRMVEGGQIYTILE